MLKKISRYIVVLGVILALTAPAAVYAGPVFSGSDAGIPAQASETAYREWQTDTRLSIRREAQLMQEAHMSLGAWDAEAEERKQQALKDPFTEKALLEADPDADIRREDGRIYYIGPNELFRPVENALDAYELAYRLVVPAGGSEKTDLRLWSKLGVNDQTVYSFQEIADSEAVQGSTLKIAVDGEDEVTAVFVNLLPEDSEDRKDSGKENVLVSREEAEKAVLSHCGSEGGAAAEIYTDCTERVIHVPMDMAYMLDLEMDAETLPDQLLWVVYTSNGAEDKETYPYLAHYVKLDGTWLYSLPVKEPGDEESRNGYRKQDVFKGMTADEYTGEITDINGRARTVTVPVMRGEDGLWYLGDTDRRIAVADFYDAAYVAGHPLHLVKSPDNRGWDNEDLYMYYNYIRAWDFYADMGWTGPDGQGTDVVILKGLAYRTRASYENACSIGKVENFQMFGYAPYEDGGKALGLVQALDVMAHEYTHSFTATVMNENLYRNDLGAINEAMSDIAGNLAEYVCRDTEDTEWMLGENTGSAIRCMSDPKKYSQPAYVWDLCYGPYTDDPGISNDNGGVHVNSSLLNRIAALLCLDHGMSYEEAAAFWMTAAMGMTPGADYRQIGALLEWAAAASGNEKYLDALEELIEEERLEAVDLPEELPEGQKLVVLRLPETETFEDENWSLLAYQLDLKSLLYLQTEFVKMYLALRQDSEDLSKITDVLQEIVEHMKLDGTKIKLDDVETGEELGDAILKILGQSGKGLVTQLLSWEERGTGEIPVIAETDKPTLYLMLNISGGGSKMNGVAVLIAGRWYDLQHLDETFVEQLIDSFFSDDTDEPEQENGIERSVEAEYLPTKGLENIRLDA